MQLKRKVVGDTLYIQDGENTILSMEEKQDDDGYRITLQGSLRSETLHNFQDELSAFASFGMDLILDLKGIEYVAPSCVDVLIQTQQRMDEIGKGSLTIVAVPDKILKEWDRNGITQVLMIEED